MMCPKCQTSPKIDEEFNKEHEVTQREVSIELAKDIQANKFDIIDGEADIDDDDVEKRVFDALIGKQDKLRVEIFDFELDKFETSIRKQIQYTTQFADKLSADIKDSLLPPELQKVKVAMEMDAKLIHGILALDKEDELADRLSKTHRVATIVVMDELVKRIQEGTVPLSAKGVNVKRVELLKELIERTYAKTNDKDVRMVTADMSKFKIDLSFEKLTESEMMIWEVFFDHKDKATGKGKRIDPLILDLNRDGKFDITGANQEGNGKIDGPTVSFDIDPSKQSWKLKLSRSPSRLV